MIENFHMDDWSILLVNEEYRVLGQRRGGFAQPDLWRLGSAIQKFDVDEIDGSVFFTTKSGNRYYGSLSCEYLADLTQSIFAKIKNLAPEAKLVKFAEFRQTFEEAQN